MFCATHKWQPLTLLFGSLFTLANIAAVFFGLYQDALKPIRVVRSNATISEIIKVDLQFLLEQTETGAKRNTRNPSLIVYNASLIELSPIAIHVTVFEFDRRNTEILRSYAFEDTLTGQTITHPKLSGKETKQFALSGYEEWNQKAVYQVVLSDFYCDGIHYSPTEPYYFLVDKESITGFGEKDDGFKIEDFKDLVEIHRIKTQSIGDTNYIRLEAFEGKYYFDKNLNYLKMTNNGNGTTSFTK